MSARQLMRSAASAMVLLLFTLAALGTALAQSTGDAINLGIQMNKELFMPSESEAVMMISLSGAEAQGTTRAPVAMAIIIDTSGSMDGQKIIDVRAAANALIDRLSEGDVLTIVTYSDSSQIILPNYLVSGNRSVAHSAVDRITATGSTCISCGLDQAYTLLSDISNSYTRRAVVLSDGNANRGVSDAGGLRAMASQALEMYNIPTSTLGVGFDYNEDIMVAMANGGNGNYYFLPDGTAVAGVLDREFAQLQNVVASNVVIRVTPTGGTSFGTIYTPGSRIEGNQLVIEVGQVVSGASRQILIPLVVPSGDLGEIVQATVTYEDGSGTSQERSASATVARTEDQTISDSSLNAEVMANFIDQQAAREVEAALEQYQNGDHAGARQRLQMNQVQLQQAAIDYNAPALQSQADEIGSLNEYFEDEEQVEEERVDGLRRHNRARAMERSAGESGSSADDAYYDSMVY